MRTPPTGSIPRSACRGAASIPQQMFDELLAIARQHIRNVALRKLVESLLLGNRDALLTHPAARRNHHAYLGGLFEHTLSVARTCVYLADKYAEYYPEMKPPLDKDLVVAGGILHDIGKLREMEQRPEGAAHTAEGSLIGHILIGRDMVREAAAAMPGGAALPADTLLRLEHVIITHQGRPEWGSPKPPMTPEALLVHCRRRHRRQVPHDGGRAARGHESRAGDVEEERVDAARLQGGPRQSLKSMPRARWPGQLATFLLKSW